MRWYVGSFVFACLLFPSPAWAQGPDSDGDGLGDFQEIHKYFTDPKAPSTAGDGVSDGDWQAVVDANLKSTFVCTRAVVPGMKAAGYGRIVNISSGAGRSVSLTGIQAYASAKAGQIGFTRQTAHELGPYGITVNSIAPGFVLSNPTSIRQWESYGEEGKRAILGNIATRRLGRPEDVANGVLFFVVEEASWVTGQVISIDGGHSIF